MGKVIIIKIIKENEQPPSGKIVVETDKINLSDFRKKLEDDDKINDKLLFSQKFVDTNKTEFVEISRGNEDDFVLKDIIENDSNNIYLVNNTTYWNFLNKLYKLDRGLISVEGIKRADDRAFILQSAKIIDIKGGVDDQKEMKQYISFISDSNMRSSDENVSLSESNRIYKKAYFEIDKLKANKTFIEDVNDAVKELDNGSIKKFEEITKKYGQSIPTKIIFGGRIENEFKLNYCRNWNCMKFQEQESIFHFVDASLREKIYSFFEKKILYSVITIEKDNNVGNVDVEENIDDNYKTKILKLPSKVSETISNNVDCSIFATVVGLNDYYHCQILTSPDKEPELMIHCLKERRTDRKILIGWIVIGYNIDLKSNFSKNKENNNMKLNVLRKDYMPYDESNNKMFELVDFSDCHCVGIPIVDKKDSLIGHYFSNDYKELHTFSYSLREKRSVKLPKFSFNVLVIPKNDPTFEKQISIKKMDCNIVTVDNNEFKIFPKFVSLCLNKSEQILLKQRLAQIEVKFLDNKDSSRISARDLKCSFFIPFKRDGLASDILDTLKKYYANSQGKNARLNEVLSNVSNGASQIIKSGNEVLSNVSNGFVGGVSQIKSELMSMINITPVKDDNKATSAPPVENKNNNTTRTTRGE
ncbi:hypothetical protein GLOIN_2v1731446 [Rhizophagus clarus]|uniref:DUF7431 domain-containing protein n=1 Tax=Rhizophagus clarus TaxID=94130 RepID=A0A8H3QMT5_9GLOM|nr:hypothetical protein GLOIN_2v1731446 [Rhizophagus clarus]